MRQRGYVQKQTTKVIRTRHVVGFSEGTDVRALLQMLAKVPTTAVIYEIISSDEDDQVTTIEFLEELKADEE